MSESLQFELHPDADQISAFVEHALPAHERELLLGHLAVCSECRAIVALSLPEPEPPVLPAAQPATQSWKLGWFLALPLAGAIAAAILTFVYLHPATVTPVSHEPQLADAHPAPQPAAPAQRAAIPARRSPAETRKTSATGAARVAPAPLPQAPAAGQATGGPILTGRNLGTPHPPFPEPAIMNGRNVASAAKAAPVSGASVNSASANAGPAATPPESTLKTSASNGSASAASSPAPAPRAPASNATVSVQSDAPTMDTASVEVSNSEIALDELEPNLPLPSRLAIASSATLGKRIVAIDTAHNIFASKDGGKHWKQVDIPSQGHPVQAGLIQPARGSVRAGRSSFAAVVAIPAQHSPAPTSTVGSAALSGTVADRTGAAIPGASITAIETSTGATHGARTDAAGRFLLNAIPTGVYEVEAQAPGFKKLQLSSVAVQPTQQAVVNVTLDISQATETVTVNASSEPLAIQTKKQAKPQASGDVGTVFQIVTDSGERWTSTDGLNWTHN